MQNKIKCSVRNCIFNDNNACQASAIEVACDDRGDNAKSSEYTCCRSFRPKQ